MRSTSRWFWEVCPFFGGGGHKWDVIVKLGWSTVKTDIHHSFGSALLVTNGNVYGNVDVMMTLIS